MGKKFISVELGQALARIGLDVTGFDLLQQVGGLQDPEVISVTFETVGKEFPMNVGAEAEIEEAGDLLRVTSGTTSVLVDKVLLSMGRIPNVDRLRLDRLGLELDSRGLPPFHRQTMQIDGLPIFIAGDFNNYRPVLHEASHEGTVAGHNAVQGRPVGFKRKTALAIAFSDPNICTVGAS